MSYAFLEGLPFWAVYLSLLGIVFFRTQATYWLGRGLGSGLRGSRYAERLGGRLTRAEELIDRYGPPVVTASFMTIGLQSAVHLTAGAMRMRFPRYCAAMVPGCLLWALIYAVGGLAALGAWWGFFQRFPASAVALAVAVAVTVWWLRRGRADSPRTRR